MAQTPQEKLDQIKKQFEELNKANEVKMTSTFSPNPAWVTQPLYWQWTIRGMTPAEKRKSRWQHAWDAAKWALSSIYWAAAFIPEVIWQIGAAWIDQLAWTNTQDKVDNFFWYIPNKLRDSAGSTYHFDKWQEYTDDALMVASLLTAWATWPKAPKTRLQNLAKNPWKYDPIQAWQIIKAAENAWVDSVKVWKVKLTPKQVNSKFRLNWDADEAALTNDIYSKFDFDWAPAYQQKLYSQYNNAANGKNMSTFEDIPSQRFNTYNSQDTFWWYWYDRPKRQLPETELNNLYRPLTKEQIAEMRQYLREAEWEWNRNPMYEDAVERWLYEFADAERAAANTSRARADAIKNRNMSASERLKRAKRSPADERAKDSANEQYAALDADADMARNDVKNMTLEEMYELWKAINWWQ